MSDKKTELMRAFTDALGAFVTEGLKGLRGEKALLVNIAHERGAGALRVIVDTSPAVTIAVYLLPADETLQPVELFTVHDLPSGVSN